MSLRWTSLDLEVQQAASSRGGQPCSSSASRMTEQSRDVAELSLPGSALFRNIIGTISQVFSGTKL